MQGRTRNSGDVASGLILAALGLYIVVQARHWDYLVPDGPGPGFFPLWYGIAMIVLSLAVLASGLRRRAAPAPATQWSRSGRALAAWLAFAVSVALCKPLGFLTSFALLAFFITGVLYRRPLRIAAVAAVSSAVGLYLVFPLLLGMSLPVGILGF
jgi:putative tricarboxylic transport membrane protein